jgi:hypothetical protein
MRDAAGHWLPSGPAQELRPGQVEAVSPRVGDVHRVSNVLSDQVSISIHVYGANIGAVKRSVFFEDGARSLCLGLQQCRAAQSVGPLGRGARRLAASATP